MAKKQEWPKLPKRFKNKWVKALRSGKYKQATGTLADTNMVFDENGDLKDTEILGYCCLGVACVIQGAHPLELDGYGTIDKIVAKTTKIDIPKVLIGDTISSPLIRQLTNMNDGNVLEGTKKKGFKAIATWIEKNL